MARGTVMKRGRLRVVTAFYIVAIVFAWYVFSLVITSGELQEQYLGEEGDDGFVKRDMGGGEDDGGGGRRHRVPPGMGDIDAIAPLADINAPGEMNMGIYIDPAKLPPDQKKIYDDGYTKNGFNQMVSDMISVRRRLPDFREKQCLKYQYRDVKDLPDTSVIIIFYNEAWSTLLRTVHSVFDNSPPEVIKEIILVDDFSHHDHLKQPLKDYMAKLGKVKIVRTKGRMGLTKARLEGYYHATGTVLTYLDSHCECTKGWLVPMLDRIADNRTNVVMPHVDTIFHDTFNMSAFGSENMQVGGLRWSMMHYWKPILPRDAALKKYPTDPTRSPTMIGGLFAIEKQFFTDIGAYDPGADGVFWGGENIDLSFKVWMCGGVQEIIPCSRVGHVFRHGAPYKYGAVHLNTHRIAEVWLDEFKEYFYDLQDKKNVSYGDISAQIKDRQKCKSFKWFIKNVMPDQFIPGNTYAAGEIRNVKTQLCLDKPVDPIGDYNLKPIDMIKCHMEIYGRVLPYYNQYWYLTKDNQIFRENGCFDYADSEEYLFIYGCHGQGGNQRFEYKEDGRIYHMPTNKCLTATDHGKVHMKACTEEFREMQMWQWKRQVPRHDIL